MLQHTERNTIDLDQPIPFELVVDQPLEALGEYASIPYVLTDAGWLEDLPIPYVLTSPEVGLEAA